MTDKFGISLGIMKVEVNGSKFEIKPNANDLRNFKKIVYNKEYENDYLLKLEVFEKYSDRLGSTDIPVIFAAMLDDLELNGRVGKINAD